MTVEHKLGVLDAALHVVLGIEVNHVAFLFDGQGVVVVVGRESKLGQVLVAFWRLGVMEVHGFLFRVDLVEMDGV